MKNNQELNILPPIYSPVDIERVRERPEALKFIWDSYKFLDKLLIDAPYDPSTKRFKPCCYYLIPAFKNSYVFEKKLMHERIRKMNGQQIKALILINIYYEKNYADKSLGIHTRYEPGYQRYEEFLFEPISKLFHKIEMSCQPWKSSLENLNIIAIWNDAIDSSYYPINRSKFHINENQLDRISFDPKNNTFKSCFNNLLYNECAIQAIYEGLLKFDQFVALCQDGRLDIILENHEYIFQALRENLVTVEYLQCLHLDDFKFIINRLKSKENIKILKNMKACFKASILLFLIGGLTLSTGAVYYTVSQYNHLSRLPMIILFTAGIITTIASIITNTGFGCSKLTLNYHQVLDKFFHHQVLNELFKDESRPQDFAKNNVVRLN